MVQFSSNLFFSTASGQVYRLMPLIKRVNSPDFWHLGDLSLRAAAAAAAASFRGFLTAAAGRALSRGESRVAAEPPHLPVAALSRSPAELPPPLSWLVPCSLPTCRTIGWSSSRGDTCRSGTSTTRRVPSTRYRLTTPSPCVSLILSPIPSCRAK